MNTLLKMTPSQAKKMIDDRKCGFYKTEHTLSEVILCLHNKREDEVAFTLLRAHGVFSAYTLRDIMSEVMRWRSMGMKCLPCNMREIELEGKKGWMIVIQPKELKDDDPASGLCPLALALGTMVSGFTYICHNKGIAETIVRALN